MLPGACLYEASAAALSVTGVFLGLAALGAILADMLQTGWLFSSANLCAKMSKLDPIQGAARLLKGSRDSWQLLAKAVLVVLVFLWLFRDVLAVLPSLLLSSDEEQIRFFRFSVGRFAASGAVLLLAASGADYWLQRRRYYKELAMSRAELRREYREDEGDPHIKSRRRALQEALAYQAAVARIRKAKVVIVERA